jgi:SAM-dependent methyltransferase
VAATHYDGIAEEYDAFLVEHADYYRPAHEALRRLLGPGPGRCLDVGCGGGRVIDVALELGWQVTGLDASSDQLGIARLRHPNLELVEADASALPFADGSFDAAYSTFTHTDLDDFGGAVSEASRILRPGGRLVYIGNHPCFVGATQERRDAGPPLLHPGYRHAGRVAADAIPGVSRTGWHTRVGSLVHLPLGPFLAAFAGFTLLAVEEVEDGFDYPRTIALAWSKP